MCWVVWYIVTILWQLYLENSFLGIPERVAVLLRFFLLRLRRSLSSLNFSSVNGRRDVLRETLAEITANEQVLILLNVLGF